MARKGLLPEPSAGSPLVCSVASFPPSPSTLCSHPYPVNNGIKADRAIHSLFTWRKNHYKNFTKEPSGANAPSSHPLSR